MNRWAKNGLLDRVFEQLQLQQIVRIRIEAFSLDSTSVKVHPHGTGALKKNELRAQTKLPTGVGLLSKLMSGILGVYSPGIPLQRISINRLSVRCGGSGSL